MELILLIILVLLIILGLGILGIHRDDIIIGNEIE